jgi:hypothetical protein
MIEFSSSKPGCHNLTKQLFLARIPPHANGSSYQEIIKHRNAKGQIGKNKIKMTCSIHILVCKIIRSDLNAC